jgi:hypothetical protein
LGANTYLVYVRDANGCKDSLSVVLEDQLGPDLVSTTDVDPTCVGFNDGSISIDNVSGGASPYNYSIDGTTYGLTSMFEDLVESVYTVYVRDANGCLDSLSVELTDPDPFTAAITAGEPLCFSPLAPGSAEFTISGGPDNGSVLISYVIDGQAAAEATVTLDSSGNATYLVPAATADVTVTIVSVTDSTDTCTYPVGTSATVDVRDPVVTSPISHD